MLNFRGVTPPPQKKGPFSCSEISRTTPTSRMGVAAAPYGKKLGQMLADDEVAKNPGCFFLANEGS